MPSIRAERTNRQRDSGHFIPDRIGNADCRKQAQKLKVHANFIISRDFAFNPDSEVADGGGAPEGLPERARARAQPPASF